MSLLGIRPALAVNAVLALGVIALLAGARPRIAADSA
jgi:hypothetical protein